MDSKCYMPDQTWCELCSRIGLTEPALCEQRYDLVLHLVTAADGAEDAFTTEGNSARTETLQEARELDQKMQTVWARHPAVALIDNGNHCGGERGLSAKMARATAVVRAKLGLTST